MKDIYDAKKTLTVLSYLLEQFDGKLSCQKLFSLLYLVDRESLLRYGETMTGDTWLLTKDGVLFETTYQMLRKIGAGWEMWLPFLEKEGKKYYDSVVVLRRGIDSSELSRADRAILDEVVSLHGEETEATLINVINTLPECKGALVENSKVRLKAEKILKANGLAKCINNYRENIKVKEELACLASVLGN